MCAIILGFKCHLGFYGIYLAWAFAVFVMTMGQYYTIKNANWYKAAKESSSRLNVPAGALANMSLSRSFAGGHMSFNHNRSFAANHSQSFANNLSIHSKN